MKPNLKSYFLSLQKDFYSENSENSRILPQILQHANIEFMV